MLRELEIDMNILKFMYTVIALTSGQLERFRALSILNYDEGIIIKWFLNIIFLSNKSVFIVRVIALNNIVTV